MKIIFLNPSHHKNLDALRRMCDKTGVDLEITHDFERCRNPNYDILISNSHFFNPDLIPRPVKIIFGPQLFILPEGDIVGEINDEWSKRCVDNTLSKWNEKCYLQAVKSMVIPTSQFPFAVDTQKFAPLNKEKTFDCLIYFKHRNRADLESVKQILDKKNLSYKIVSYGSYNENDYIQLLQECKFMLSVDAHESQGFALQEAMSCGVPLLVFDIRSVYDEQGTDFFNKYKPLTLEATSVGYWSDECGLKTTEISEIPALVDQMMGSYKSFNPRKYIVDNLSEEPCMKRILTWANVANKMKVAFWDNGLGERGTSVMLYDYAHFNETILGNESIIMYNTTHYSNKPYAVQKFKDRFPVFGVDEWSKVDQVLLDNKCDVLYITKSGGWDGQISRVCKTVVHAVFVSNEPHGNVYGAISDWINTDCKTNIPVVPYIIRVADTNDNLRAELNIPKDALVFGTYSGAECFDIPYVQQAVRDISTNPNYSNIYFVFMNIKYFMTSNENVRFLPGTSDLEYKRKFINTCDAMLYGRDRGETFGAAVGEFCISGKPVICRANEPGNYHLTLLGDSAILHNNYQELYDILTNWNEDHAKKMCPENYARFSPENVMQTFKKVFLD